MASAKSDEPAFKLDEEKKSILRANTIASKKLIILDFIIIIVVHITYTSFLIDDNIANIYRFARVFEVLLLVYASAVGCATLGYLRYDCQGTPMPTGFAGDRGAPRYVSEMAALSRFILKEKI